MISPKDARLYARHLSSPESSTWGSNNMLQETQATTERQADGKEEEGEGRPRVGQEHVRPPPKKNHLTFHELFSFLFFSFRRI